MPQVLPSSINALDTSPLTQKVGELPGSWDPAVAHFHLARQRRWGWKAEVSLGGIKRKRATSLQFGQADRPERDVTGVQGDAANLNDLARLLDAGKREKDHIDVLFTSAGTGGGARKLGKISEKDFDTIFGLNTRGTLFTVQEALPLFNDGGPIFMTGSIASVKAWPDCSVHSASNAALRSFARTWLNELKDRRIRVNMLSPGQIATPIQEQMFDEETKRQFESLIPRERWGDLKRLRQSRCFLLQTTRSM